MAEVRINGVTRTEFGKGAARRARREGLVPAVIYGHGETPRHITLNAKEISNALKQSNVLLDITIDGKNELTLPKEIVRDPLKRTLEHIDLLIVRRDEMVIVSVPVRTVGEFDRDGILEHVNNSIEVEVNASSIPEFLELKIEHLKLGESMYASDVTLPEGVELISDPEMIIVNLSEQLQEIGSEQDNSVVTDESASSVDSDK